MILSSAWMQGMLLTFVAGFAILGYLALRVYEEHAPVPARVVDEAGKEIFTGEEIMRGQDCWCWSSWCPWRWPGTTHGSCVPFARMTK
jgi:nitric oxide reductase large subunit